MKFNSERRDFNSSSEVTLYTLNKFFIFCCFIIFQLPVLNSVSSLKTSQKMFQYWKGKNKIDFRLNFRLEMFTSEIRIFSQHPASQKDVASKSLYWTSFSSDVRDRKSHGSESGKQRKWKEKPGRPQETLVFYYLLWRLFFYSQSRY